MLMLLRVSIIDTEDQPGHPFDCVRFVDSFPSHKCINNSFILLLTTFNFSLLKSR